MKLEHLAPYLPYKLKLFYTHTNKIGTLSNVYTIGEGYDDEDTKISVDHYDGDHLWMFKPILHPLSDLTKEITHNGETFVPSDYCNGSYYFTEHDRWVWNKILSNDRNIQQRITDLPYFLITKLISWHFDVFGLIEKGEAVDINTI